MAHRSRERFVNELLRQLPPNTEVVWDRRGSRWDTGKRSLRAGDRGPNTTHVLIVQDDAVLCDRFFEAATLAVSHSRGHPVGFYIGSLRPHNPVIIKAGAIAARRRGTPWIQMAGPWWAVSVAIPVDDVEPICDHGDANPVTENFDTRMARYYASLRTQCWYTYPSLVSHRPVAENPSLVPGRTADRKATWYIGDRDPFELDWEADPVPVHGHGTLSGETVAVVVEGGGSYDVCGIRFRGITPVAVEHPVLEVIRSAGPEWVRIEE